MCVYMHVYICNIDLYRCEAVKRPITSSIYVEQIINDKEKCQNHPHYIIIKGNMKLDYLRLYRKMNKSYKGHDIFFSEILF